MTTVTPVGREGSEVISSPHPNIVGHFMAASTLVLPPGDHRGTYRAQLLGL